MNGGKSGFLMRDMNNKEVVPIHVHGFLQTFNTFWERESTRRHRFTHLTHPVGSDVQWRVVV